MENKIVQMQPCHVEEVARIEQELISTPWSKKLILELSEQSNAVAKVLLVGDKVVGYYSFYMIGGEADINNIAIDRPYQGRGLSKLLMQDLIAECASRGIEEITLEVGANNAVAQSLYIQFGFKEEGRRKNYYNNTEDAIIMWRR